MEQEESLLELAQKGSRPSRTAEDYRNEKLKSRMAKKGEDAVRRGDTRMILQEEKAQEELTLTPEDEGSLRLLAAKTALDKAAPEATDTEKMEGLAMYQQDKMAKEDTGQGNPELLLRSQMMKENADKIPEIAQTDKETTGTYSKSIGALLSILLPTLAGAAIGGKRGAMYGAIGAGEAASESLKEEAEQRRAEDAAILEEAKWQRRRTEKLDDKKEDAEFKATLKSDAKKGEEKDDSWAGTMSKTVTDKLRTGPQMLQTLGKFKDRLTALKSPALWFKASSNFASTEASKIVNGLQGIMPDVAKVFGDTGNVAVQEQVIRLKFMLGNWTASSADAADRVDLVINMLKNKLTSLAKVDPILRKQSPEDYISYINSGASPEWGTPLQNVDKTITTFLYSAAVHGVSREKALEVLTNAKNPDGTARYTELPTKEAFDYVGFK